MENKKKEISTSERKSNVKMLKGKSRRDIARSVKRNNMLTKYQMIKFIDFCEVWFLPESAARVATIVGDHRSHTPRH
ncbi:hypothetical protein TNCV_1853391 [Trichonephila clavipes]|nr:hypothetical protein TNCV_1853391 [Trichonephila clavipes]